MEIYFRMLDIACSSVEEPKKKNLPYDPLKSKVEVLERIMRENGLIDASFLGCNAARVLPHLLRDSIAEVCNREGMLIDYRIHFSHLLTVLLRKLSSAIKDTCSRAEDPSTVLSMQQLSMIDIALQFFIPTAVKPFVGEGVIMHQGKSDLISHWRPVAMTGNDFKAIELESALGVFESLISSCDPVKSCIVKKYLPDYISLNEQLIEYGRKEGQERYHQFILKSVERPLLMTSLFVMLSGNRGQPVWMKRALGSLITELLLQPQGLYHMTTAITEGANCFGDFAFVQALSRILVKLPRGALSSNYYESLCKQFLDVIEHHPNASEAAVCFAVVLDMLPKQWSHHVIRELMLPWEDLWGCTCRRRHDGKDHYNHLLDRSLKILSLYAKAIPPNMRLPKFGVFKKYFHLWVYLYASYVAKKEAVKNLRGNALCYENAAEGIMSILLRMLRDPAFGSLDGTARFLVRQIEKVYRYEFPVLDYTEVFVEDVSDQSQSSRNHEFHFKHVHIYFVKPDDPHDVFVRFEKGILALLKVLSENREPRLSIRTAMYCIKRWGQLGIEGRKDDESSEAESDNETSEFALDSDDDDNNVFEGGRAELRQKVNYLLNDLLETVTDTERLAFDENLGNIIGIPSVILDVSTIRLHAHINAIRVDILAGRSDENIQFENLRNNSMLALSILYNIVLFRCKEIGAFYDEVKEAKRNLCEFMAVVKKLSKSEYGRFEEHIGLADSILQCLKTQGIEDKDGEKLRGDIESSPKSAQGAQTFSLCEIVMELSDDAEAIRGHALLTLAKGVRKRNKQFLNELDSMPGIMLEVMKHVADKDSYVYLAAINAMAELAFWKRPYFDDMVEFFLNPTVKLDSLIDSFKRIDLSDEEKKTYMLIQRIKVGEAIAKVSRNLGDVAPWYFDRLVNPMLSLMLNAQDNQLRASVLSSLAELVLSCRGLNVHKHFNEMLLATNMYVRESEDQLVRRAALSLLRAIIRTYDMNILQEIPSSLKSISRCLKQLLNRDGDSIVKTYAMLCLQDIDAQMLTGFLEYENANMRRIRIK